MRHTPNGRGWDAPDLGRQNQERDRKTEQLYRRSQRQPKIPKVEPSGGPVGMVKFYSTNNMESIRSSNEINTYGVTYSTPEVLAGDGTWATVSGYEVTLEPGYYSIAVRYTFGWAAASAPKQVQLYFGDGSAIGGPEWSDTIGTWAESTLGAKGFAYTLTGPCFIPEGGGPLHAEVQWTPSSSASFQSFGGPAQITWNIMKLA